MNKHISPRLRAPLLVFVAGAVAGGVGVAQHGFSPGPVSILVVLLVGGPIALYVWGGQDSDTAAGLRAQRDERQ